MIYVKDTDVLISLMQVGSHPILLDVVHWLCNRFPQLICVTDGHRPGDPKCHGTDPLRAIDIRSTLFQAPKAIEVEINNHWEYDPERTHMGVAKYHRVKNPDGSWGGYHFHIQVHPNTRRRD
jgi:hypothetical protein